MSYRDKFLERNLLIPKLIYKSNQGFSRLKD